MSAVAVPFSSLLTYHSPGVGRAFVGHICGCLSSSFHTFWPVRFDEMLENVIVCVFLVQLLATDGGGQCVEKANVTMQEYYLFDFTRGQPVENWEEQSDTLRDVGMSKAALLLHQNKNYRRAVFFTLLNPQPNGAGFAGVRVLGNFNLWGHNKLQIQCRGQGQFQGYKIILRHKCLNEEPNNSYEQYFQAPKDEFGIQTLPLSEFKAYYRGKRSNSSEPLDISQITSIGIQAYGGVYRQVRQRGPATLEIDWVKATP